MLIPARSRVRRRQSVSEKRPREAIGKFGNACCVLPAELDPDQSVLRLFVFAGSQSQVPTEAFTASHSEVRVGRVKAERPRAMELGHGHNRVVIGDARIARSEALADTDAPFDTLLVSQVHQRAVYDQKTILGFLAEAPVSNQPLLDVQALILRLVKSSAPESVIVAFDGLCIDDGESAILEPG